MQTACLSGLRTWFPRFASFGLVGIRVGGSPRSVGADTATCYSDAVAGSVYLGAWNIFGIDPSKSDHSQAGFTGAKPTTPRLTGADLTGSLPTAVLSSWIQRTSEAVPSRWSVVTGCLSLEVDSSPADQSPDANGHGDQHADAHPDRGPHAHSNTDADGNTDADADGDRNADTGFGRGIDADGGGAADGGSDPDRDPAPLTHARQPAAAHAARPTPDVRDRSGRRRQFAA